MTSMHFYAWKAGLKTGMYYLRTKSKAAAIQFTVDQVGLALVPGARARARLSPPPHPPTPGLPSQPRSLTPSAPSATHPLPRAPLGLTPGCW
jgi:hypothetical protein